MSGVKFGEEFILLVLVKALETLQDTEVIKMWIRKFGGVDQDWAAQGPDLSLG